MRQDEVNRPPLPQETIEALEQGMGKKRKVAETGPSKASNKTVVAKKPRATRS